VNNFQQKKKPLNSKKRKKKHKMSDREKVEDEPSKLADEIIHHIFLL